MPASRPPHIPLPIAERAPNPDMKKAPAEAGAFPEINQLRAR